MNTPWNRSTVVVRNVGASPAHPSDILTDHGRVFTGRSEWPCTVAYVLDNPSVLDNPVKTADREIMSVRYSASGLGAQAAPDGGSGLRP